MLEGKYDLPLIEAQYQLESVTAGEYVAQALGIETGSPIFLIERTSYTEGPKRFDYEKLYYRVDLIKFVTRLSRVPATDVIPETADGNGDHPLAIRGRLRRKRARRRAGHGERLFIVPILTLLFDVDIHVAIGASLVLRYRMLMRSAASFIKGRLTNIRIAIILETATTLGALTGVFLIGIIPTAYLYGLFAAILAISAQQMLALAA